MNTQQKIVEQYPGINRAYVLCTKLYGTSMDDCSDRIREDVASIIEWNLDAEEHTHLRAVDDWLLHAEESVLIHAIDIDSDHPETRIPEGSPPGLDHVIEDIFTMAG